MYNNNVHRLKEKWIPLARHYCPFLLFLRLPWCQRNFIHLSRRFPFPKRFFGSKGETRSFRAEWCEKHSLDASTDHVYRSDLVVLYLCLYIPGLYLKCRTFYPRHQCPPLGGLWCCVPPWGDSGAVSPPGGTLVPRVGQLCLGINVPCGHICLGIIVRGTMVPRNQCPGGSGA